MCLLQVHVIVPFHFRLDKKYTVTVVRKDSLASIQQKAAEAFIQSQLYGPGSHRTTSKKEAIGHDYRKGGGVTSWVNLTSG